MRWNSSSSSSGSSEDEAQAGVEGEDSQSDVSLYSVRASEVEGDEAWDEVLSDTDAAYVEQSSSDPEYHLSDME